MSAPNAQARKLIEQMRLTVIAKNIIYDAIEIAREMMEAMRAPEIEEKIVGAAEVRQVFSVSKTGNVAGCLITEGAAAAGSASARRARRSGRFTKAKSPLCAASKKTPPKCAPESNAGL